MKVWITKYCLTKGIIEEEVQPCDNPDLILRGRFDYMGGRGTDWHTDLDAAVERANNVRAARLLSLKRKIAKLQELRF
jgi:hypothetical protein